jgi:thioester reductase-like protein
VILTGATGFLGCHILHELLTGQKEVSTIVCVVRGSSEQEARERLQSAYQHYFSASPFDDDARVVVVDGDITDPQTYFHLLPLIPHPSPLFIHCAADVRYYAPHQEIERTNIVGTRIVADFCLRHHLRLIHISTLSVLHANGLHSSYITSKKEAEAYITRLTGQRLQAQIIRLGILAPRSTDGLFQRNADQSLFFSLLRLFGQLRAFPASIAHITPDVMPVDQAASAITGHALHPNTCNICINLTQPTPWKSLLAQATEMADNRFFELLCQYNDTPFATLPSIDRNTICSILQSYINNLR